MGRRARASFRRPRSCRGERCTHGLSLYRGKWNGKCVHTFDLRGCMRDDRYCGRLNHSADDSRNDYWWCTGKQFAVYTMNQSIVCFTITIIRLCRFDSTVTLCVRASCQWVNMVYSVALRGLVS